jgi:hypothetical protein
MWKNQKMPKYHETFHSWFSFSFVSMSLNVRSPKLSLKKII